MKKEDPSYAVPDPTRDIADVTPGWWVGCRMPHAFRSDELRFAALESDPRPALAQFDAHLEELIAWRVEAATAGMVRRVEPDLTTSKDQYGHVRCGGCGMPNDGHDEAACPFNAAHRWLKARGARL